MSEGAQIIRGPWCAVPPGAGALPGAAEPSPERGRDDRAGEPGPGQMHLGFVVRACAVELGREPSPEDLARWANHRHDARGEFCLFGRAISVAEARVILAHPGRAVTARAAQPGAADDPA